MVVVGFQVKGKTGEGEEQKFDSETFTYGLSKVLAHLLAESCLSNSQGFLLDTISGADRNKLNAALYSLYSGLPRRFRLPSVPAPRANGTIAALPEPPAYHLDKLAFIIVSSRKCDLNLKVSEY